MQCRPNKTPPYAHFETICNHLDILTTLNIDPSCSNGDLTEPLRDPMGPFWYPLGPFRDPLYHWSTVRRANKQTGP